MSKEPIAAPSVIHKHHNDQGNADRGQSKKRKYNITESHWALQAQLQTQKEFTLERKIPWNKHFNIKTKEPY